METRRLITIWFFLVFFGFCSQAFAYNCSRLDGAGNVRYFDEFDVQRRYRIYKCDEYLRYRKALRAGSHNIRFEAPGSFNHGVKRRKKHKKIKRKAQSGVKGRTKFAKNKRAGNGASRGAGGNGGGGRRVARQTKIN